MLPPMRTMYLLYWVMIAGGILLWTIVGLTAE
jgi:hypothetical protein